MSTPPFSMHTVIGANYGDEGKGATVNYLARRLGADKVVRFNGGNQAGHTVVSLDEKRHIFNSYSSGTFAGAESFISEPCTVDPIAIYREGAKLTSLLGKSPKILIDANAKIVTILDVIFNQAEEILRGDLRYGSCGCGIGSTVQRNLDGYRLPFGFVTRPYTESFYRMKDIAKYYSIKMANLLKKQHGHFTSGGLDAAFKHHDGLFDNLKRCAGNFNAALDLLHWSLTPEICEWIGEALWFPSHGNPSRVKNHFSCEGAPIIFEGAQGLLLDENDADHQPHVTWSSTRAFNALNVLSKNREKEGYSNFPDFEHHLYYVTRTYLTRHGAGPIFAGTELPDVEIEDKTNKPNTWQGSLRVASLDLIKLKNRIQRDVVDYARTLGKTGGIKIHLVVTWADANFGRSVEEFETIFGKAAGNIFPPNSFEGIIYLDGRNPLGITV